MQREAFSFKVVLLGNAGVGKSCISMRFIRDEYIEDNETTIGAAFMTKTISLEDCTVRTEIWDTAGQERYRALAPMYYRGAQAAIVVYDITNRESFDGAKMWIKELQRRADANMVIALAGNKTDLSNKRAVDSEVSERDKERERKGASGVGKGQSGGGWKRVKRCRAWQE